MKVKEGDKLPDAKVFVLEKDPKEVSIKEIIGNDKAILFVIVYLVMILIANDILQESSLFMYFSIALLI